MAAYLEMMRIRFLAMLAYRVNYYSGVVIYVVYIGSYYFIWQAVYAGRAALGGLTAAQMTTYLAVAWMSRAFWFNNLDREISNEIRDGTVAVQFIRPYNYLVAKLAGALGEGLFRLAFFAAPGLAAAALVFPVRFPSDARLWVVFAAATLLAFAVNSLFNVIAGLVAFFTLNNTGILHTKRVLVDLFSGLFLPLGFYPAWAQDAPRWLPFQAISYLPSLVFTGALRGPELWRALAVQAFWIAVLAVAAAWLWRRAGRRLVVQGG